METHIQADYASGALELATRAGAELPRQLDRLPDRDREGADLPVARD